MHVALILPSLAGGGAQRVIVDLARGLLDRSISVDIVLVRDEGPLRDQVPNRAGLVVLGGRQVSLAAPRLARYLRRRRPDAALSSITHMNLCTVAAAQLVRPRVPVIVLQTNHLSSHARHAVLPQDRLAPLLVRGGYPKADAIVAVSDGVADDLVAGARVPRQRIQVIYNPVDFARMAAEVEAPVEHPWLAPKTGPVLLAAGRLTAQKDYATLLRAVALLGEEVRLVILGEGELRADLENMVRHLGLAGRVDMPGFAPASPYYAASDVFVLSSRWEGLPTVLVEALYFGTPIVATDCPSGPREILGAGRWGRLVPPGDPASLARAISEALEDGRGSTDPAACDRFRLDHMTDRYVELFTAVARGTVRHAGRLSRQ